MLPFKPSYQQQKFFDFIINDTRNAVISAVAGAGKTTTLLKAIELIPKDKTILFMAFNKSIAKELIDRIPNGNNINVKTVHGYGYNLIIENVNTNIDNFKYNKLIYEIITNNIESLKKYELNSSLAKYIMSIQNIVGDIEDLQIRDYMKSVVDLCNLGRLNLIDVKNKNKGVKELNKIANKHVIDNLDNQSSVAWYLINIGSSITKIIDFTDMIYLPIIFNLVNHKYDYVLIDECQDLSSAQRILMNMALMPSTGRFFAVGDQKQNIYSFVGADSDSYVKLCNMPNTVQFPLSVTYRCQPSIVNMVKHINPDIISYTNTDSGEILTEYSYNDLKDGDMVLCRETFPIVSLCVTLISQNKKAYIIGSDIGLILSRTIIDCEKKVEVYDMQSVFAQLYFEKNKLIEKLMSTNHITLTEATNNGMVVMLDEKIKIIEGLTDEFDKPSDVIKKINNIFSDENKSGICLSTIHKSKGLESERVFILHKELMPSKYAKEEWEFEQEKNLIYVAYTRAKKTLGFITDYNAFDSHRTYENDVKRIKETKHVGNVGMKMRLELIITTEKEFDGKFGKTMIYDLIDKDGNLFNKFGDISDKFIKDDEEIRVNTKVGAKVVCYAIIKEHKIFNGKKITQLGKLSSF
jgi:DNA helicase-2/ATP-dependent DNA helicase PcrA